MTHVVCALCGSDDTRVLATRGIFQKNGPIIPFVNVVCLHDGLVYRTPRETAEELDVLYKKTYIEKRHSLEDERAASAFVTSIHPRNKGAQVAEFLKDTLRPGGRVLDVGSGLGLVGGYLKRACGVSVLGVEPSVLSGDVSRKEFGMDVFSGTFDEFLEKRTPNQVFDCIILHHVFEHFPDPQRKIQKLTELLAPRGTLYIEVPNVLDYKKPKSQFFDLLHLYNYTPETLFRMLTAGGLTVVKWNRDKKYRIQVVAARATDDLPATEIAEISGAAVARRVILYNKRQDLVERMHGYLDPLRHIKRRLFH